MHDVTSILFLVLGALAALGFLVVIGRRRQVPGALKVFLIVGAVLIVLFVAWLLVLVLGVNPALRAK